MVFCISLVCDWFLCLLVCILRLCNLCLVLFVYLGVVYFHNNYPLIRVPCFLCVYLSNFQKMFFLFDFGSVDLHFLCWGGYLENLQILFHICLCLFLVLLSVNCLSPISLNYYYTFYFSLFYRYVVSLLVLFSVVFLSVYLCLCESLSIYHLLFDFLIY